MQKFTRRAGTAWRIFRTSGPKAVVFRTKHFLTEAFNPQQSIGSLVKIEDAVAVDPFNYTPPKPLPGKSGPYTFNWILCPPGIGAGGHTTMFRFVRHLETQGHTCRLYIYSSRGEQAEAELRSILQNHFAPMKAEMILWDGTMLPADAIVATGWETAYPAARSDHPAKRFYLVQDYEPSFYAVGSESVLAENSYRFGFYGITAGKWLAGKLSDEFDMKTDHFDFGSDATQYRFEQKGERKKVLFYARPITERRGFELGVMALELFHKRHPEYEINLFGWNIDDYTLPFPMVSHGVISHDALNRLYNECAAGLVLSLTNMSLLPLELISSGCIPVVNDAPNNRLVSDNAYIAYTPNAPRNLADALSAIVERSDLPTYAAAGSASVKNLSWDESTRRVEAIFNRELS